MSYEHYFQARDQRTAEALAAQLQAAGLIVAEVPAPYFEAVDGEPLHLARSADRVAFLSALAAAVGATYDGGGVYVGTLEQLDRGQ